MSTTVLERPMAPDVATPPLEDAPPQRFLLSEAIRQGARLHPQGRCQLYNRDSGATCALGAAIVGLWGPDWTLDPNETFRLRTVESVVLEGTGVDLNQPVPAPPELGGFKQALGPIIVRLNDGYRWSRERIADYIASLGL